MTIEELKLAVQNKVFQSKENGWKYHFIPDNTFQIYPDMQKSTHYTWEEQDGNFILKGINFFGNEPLKIEVISNINGCLELKVEEQYSKKIIGTWIEVDK